MIFITLKLGIFYETLFKSYSPDFVYVTVSKSWNIDMGSNLAR